jgi:hypothetical protein
MSDKCGFSRGKFFVWLAWWQYVTMAYISQCGLYNILLRCSTGFRIIEKNMPYQRVDGTFKTRKI